MSLRQTVMIFGVFDGLHDGHRFFISQAATLGDSLHIVVAPDHDVRNTKQKNPRMTLAERIQKIQQTYPEATVIEGDTERNSWAVIKKYQPTIIACGYDQESLFQALEKAKAQFPFLERVIKLGDYQGEKLHSSLL